MAKRDHREVESREARRARNEETERRERKAESREHTEAVLQATDELLDEVDKVLRKSLDLDENADDKIFDERAKDLAEGYKQKGGQ